MNFQCRYCRHGEHSACKQIDWTDSLICECLCKFAADARARILAARATPGCTCDGQSILNDGPNPDCPLHGQWRSDPGPPKTLAERVRYIADGPHPWIPGGESNVAFLKEIATALEDVEKRDRAAGAEAWDRAASWSLDQGTISTSEMKWMQRENPYREA